MCNDGDRYRWVSTWGSPCDCGACPVAGTSNLFADADEGGPLICLPCLPADGSYQFESWVATDEVERSVVIGYAPLFDDEPFCRHHAEPLLLAGSDFIALAKGEGGKVYVHCEKGYSRAAAVLICYLMKYEGMSLLEAATELKARRARVSPNGALVDALARIEQTLHATPSDVNDVNAVLKKAWLPDYRAGRVKLNKVDVIM